MIAPVDTAEETNRNVANIAEIAEQNADGAGQVEAANEQLAALAGTLRQAAARFKT